MPAPAPVTVVVLNYNGWQDTLACIASLLAQDYPALSILLVDNASTNDSVARIRVAFAHVELIQAAANHGFASGNNLGIRLALERGAQFVWLLNNDTVVPPDTLSQLVATAHANPNNGITGTVLRYHHDPAKIQAWGGGHMATSIGFTTHFTAPAALGPDTFLTFASVLLRCEMLKQVGLLDEDYFMYFEDADFCFRARSAGWHLAVAPGTAVLHKEGGSSTASSPESRNRSTRIVTASGMRFLANHGRPRALAPWLFLISRIAKRAAKADFAGVRAVLRGAADWRRNQPLAFQQEAQL